MLLRLALLLATLGLAANLVLWSAPLTIGASALLHGRLPDLGPTLHQVLSVGERSAPTRPSMFEALVSLIGTERDAMQVAGQALSEPVRPDLAVRADAASGHVLQAARAYVSATQAVLDGVPRLGR